MKKIETEHNIDIRWTPDNPAYKEADAALNAVKQVVPLTSIKKEQEMGYFLTTQKRFGGKPGTI